MKKSEPKITNHGIASLKNYQPVLPVRPPENRRVGRSKLPFGPRCFQGRHPPLRHPSIPWPAGDTWPQAHSSVPTMRQEFLNRFGLENPEDHLKLAAKIWVSSKKYPSNRWIPPKKTHYSEVLLVFFLFGFWCFFGVFAAQTGERFTPIIFGNAAMSVMFSSELKNSYLPPSRPMTKPFTAHNF